MEVFYLVLLMLFLLLLSQWRSHRVIKTELKNSNNIGKEILRETKKTRKKIDEHIKANTATATGLKESLEKSNKPTSNS